MLNLSKINIFKLLLFILAQMLYYPLNSAADSLSEQLSEQQAVVQHTSHKSYSDPGLSVEVKEKLLQAMQDKGDNYQPRTEHFKQDGRVKYINRLILEDSPYLLQHAHNPVNWYAWGSEAFARAKRENKPVFLSIGYSTCHWCHVMERESFDNEKIADYLNQHFIAIKVDRERRPDVDKLYMMALMTQKGSGGWPMSSLLTPEGRPFFSGTYFTPEQFKQILQRTVKLWHDEETQLRLIADKITLAVQNRQSSLQQVEHIGKERVQIAVLNLLNRFDEMQGGFSGAPKFPNETHLFLLLDAVIREQNQEALEALKLTMNMMAQGGIYDQVGGGFHRYSIDNEWLVPHFEKMLYNQAHLARTYLQLFLITHDNAYQRVVTQTLDYVLRDMQALKGGFYSASDADSEGEEGKFFLWTIAQLQDTLDPVQAKLAIDLFAVTQEGNFSEDPTMGSLPSEGGGTSILNLPYSLSEFAQIKQRSLKQLSSELDRIREKLYQQRQTRVAPAIDTKIVTAWNAMMITALAKAGKALHQEKYLKAAKKAGDFLWHTHHYPKSEQHKQAGLWRSSLNNKPSIMATQADYAYLAQSYLTLFDITENKKWLQRSEQLVQDMIALFTDKEEGTFFMSAPISNNSQDVPLFNRPKDIYDAAIPSANAVALEVLLQLYYRTGNDGYYTRAAALVASLSTRIKNSPASFSYLLTAVNQLNFAETGDIQYGSKGHVRLEKIIHPENKSVSRAGIKVEIRLDMDKNWHINSRYPKDKKLIATSVAIGKSKHKSARNILINSPWKIVQAEYPEGEELQLKFSDMPLSLYQNSASIKLILKADEKAGMNTKHTIAIPLEVTYQTCSDKVCLAPEHNTFYIFPEK